jgi:hypothetical protein
MQENKNIKSINVATSPEPDYLCAARSGHPAQISHAKTANHNSRILARTQTAPDAEKLNVGRDWQPLRQA